MNLRNRRQTPAWLPRLPLLLALVAVGPFDHRQMQAQSLPLSQTSTPDLCLEDDAAKAASALECMTGGQLAALQAYYFPDSNERQMREALANASDVAKCINDKGAFPVDAEGLRQFRCLQGQVLGFFDKISLPAHRPAELYPQDVLAWASLRIHYCMLNDAGPFSRCLGVVGQALQDYRKVFAEARERGRAAPRRARRVETDEATAIPDFDELQAFLDVVVENTLRFPKLWGKETGTTARRILCDAFELYPEHRPHLAHIFNMLIQFDGGNMASSVQLHKFLEDVVELFTPARDLPPFLVLEWPESESIACDGQAEWGFAFPRMSPRPGFRVPDRPQLEAELRDLEGLLFRSDDFSVMRNHVWEPFYRYGQLVLELAHTLRAGSIRDREVWETRHMLMGKARDAFLFRGLDPKPVHPNQVEESIGRHIRGYGDELLSGLHFDGLVDFAESYLEVGKDLLTRNHKSDLHRLLTIVHSVRNDETRALIHFPQSNLQQSELESIRDGFHKMGIGVEVRQ